MEIEEKNMRKKEMRISIKLAEDKDLDKALKKFHNENPNQRIFIISYKGKDRRIISENISIAKVVDGLKRDLGDI